MIYHRPGTKCIYSFHEATEFAKSYHQARLSETNYSSSLLQHAQDDYTNLDPTLKAVIAQTKTPPIDDSSYGGSNEHEALAHEFQAKQQNAGNGQYYCQDMAYEAEADYPYTAQEGSLVTLPLDIETATYWSHGLYASDINEEEPL